MFSADSGFSGQQGSEISPASQMSHSDDPEFTGFMHGDFYSEPDDTVRSVVLAEGPLTGFGYTTPDERIPFGSQKGQGFFFDDSEFSHDSKGFGSFHLSSATKDGTLSDGPSGLRSLQHSVVGPFSEPVREFQHSDMPSLPPTSELAATTLLIESSSPHDIGNKVLAFLKSQVTASILEVQKATYFISAEVFIQGVCCSLDVNVYEAPDSQKSFVPSWLVEFNRSSGDTFTFGTTFRLAADFLASCCMVRQGLPEKRSHLDEPRLIPCSDSASESVELEFEDVAPLLEMAGTTTLQAEAGAALYKLASGGHTVASPLIDNPQEVGAALTQLLSSDCHDAAYPAACSLVALADSGRAAPLLTSPGLLQALARNAEAEMGAASDVMCTVFAQALATAVHCCAVQLSSVAAMELQRVLEQTVNTSASNGNVVAHQHLREALSELQAVA